MRRTIVVLPLLTLSLLAAIHGSAAAFSKLVGSAECADCAAKKVSSVATLQGMRVAIGCKSREGKFRVRGVARLDRNSRFDVRLPSRLVTKDGRLREDCFAQLLGAQSGSICRLAAAKIVLKYKASNGGKHIFSTEGKLSFATAAACEAKNFLFGGFPFFKPFPKFFTPPVTAVASPTYVPQPVTVATPAQSVYLPAPVIVQAPQTVYVPTPVIVQAPAPPVVFAAPAPPVVLPAPPVTIAQPAPPVVLPAPPVTVAQPGAPVYVAQPATVVPAPTTVASPTYGTPAGVAGQSPPGLATGQPAFTPAPPMVMPAPPTAAGGQPVFLPAPQTAGGGQPVFLPAPAAGGTPVFVPAAPQSGQPTFLPAPPTVASTPPFMRPAQPLPVRNLPPLAGWTPQGSSESTSEP